MNPATTLHLRKAALNLAEGGMRPTAITQQLSIDHGPLPVSRRLVTIIRQTGPSRDAGRF